MKKLIVKTLSVMLCAAMVFSVMTCTVSAKASSGGIITDIKNDTPVVIVPGIGMSKVTLYDENGNVAKNKDGSDYAQWTVLNLETKELLGNLWKLIPSLIASILLQRDIGLTKLLASSVPGLFKLSAHNPDGSSLMNVKAIERRYPLSEYEEDVRNSFYRELPIGKYADLLGEENIYVFNFPAFSSTYEEAANLRDYIRFVLNKTGKEQLILLPISLGGTVASAYFDAYKDDRDVCKVINVVAALNGSNLIAEIFDLDFADDADELLYNCLMQEQIGEPGGYLVNIALRILPRKLARQIIDACIEEIIKTVLLNTPSMWALVPHERYEALAERWLSGDEHAVMRGLTERYYNAEKNLASTIEELTDDYEIDIFNISGCNLNFGKGWSDYQYFRFFSSSATSNSDGIIQVSSTGMGTDSVPAGGIYPSDRVPSGKIYCDDPSHNHIHGPINASTCYLPERTWFFVGQHHEIAYNDVAVKLAVNLILGNLDNVRSSEAFPQFNGTRITKKIVRDYLPAAEELDRSALDADKLSALDAALQKTHALLDDTIADDAVCKEVTEELYDALVLCGVYEKPKSPSAVEAFAAKMLKKLNDIIYNKIGCRGFSDAIFGRTFD